MEYKILRHGRDSVLMVEVNKHISEGWECLGGVSCTGEAYIQAMTFKPKTQPKAKKPPTKDVKSKVRGGGT